jgi:hypothetical protein
MLKMSIAESRVLLMAHGRLGGAAVPLPKTWQPAGFALIHSLQKKGYLAKSYPVLTSLGFAVARALRDEERS